MLFYTHTYGGLVKFSISISNIPSKLQWLSQESLDWSIYIHWNAFFIPESECGEKITSFEKTLKIFDFCVWHLNRKKKKKQKNLAQP